ncbi:MAG TPA: YigZ family protein [Candidatus Absconditabacterales bacterium]|nr:YigZ family protein [Candidatus Absconditabacterales bacterium]
MNKHFYNTILQHKEYEIPKIKGSRFIGNVFHIKNQEEAKEYLKQIQEKHKSATHNCYAYTYGTNINFDLFGNLEITPENFKQSDEGEPANTAGKPILAQIQGHKLHNIMIVVTRYFGGTLLGIGGLIQAYGECAKQTIKQSKIVELSIDETIEIKANYDLISIVMNLINKYDGKIVSEKHGDQAQITCQINKGLLSDFKKEIKNKSNGEINL